MAAVFPGDWSLAFFLALVSRELSFSVYWSPLRGQMRKKMKKEEEEEGRRGKGGKEEVEEVEENGANQ